MKESIGPMPYAMVKSWKRGTEIWENNRLKTTIKAKKIAQNQNLKNLKTTETEIEGTEIVEETVAEILAAPSVSATNRKTRLPTIKNEIAAITRSVIIQIREMVALVGIPIEKAVVITSRKIATGIEIETEIVIINRLKSTKMSMTEDIR